MKKEEAFEKLEELQRKKKRMARARVASGIVLLLLLVVVRRFDNLYLYGILFLVLLVCAFAEDYYDKKVWQPAYQSSMENFKNTYIVPMVSGIDGFSDLSFDTAGGISWEELRNTGVVDCAEKELYSSSDLLEGWFRGVWFAVANVTTKRPKETERGRFSRERTIFSGRMLKFRLPDTFPACRGRIQFFQQMFQDISGQLPGYKIKTGDERFDQEFTVYTEYQDTPAAILTPELRDRFLQLLEAALLQISVSICNGYMYIAVDWERQFEVDCKISMEEQKQQFLEDANLLSLVERILLEGEKTED